jgi:two-component system LytT family response regulator
MESLLSLSPFPKRKPSRIAVKLKRKIVFMDPSEIVSIEARGSYVLLQHRSSVCRLRHPLSRIADELRPYGFVRIHRSSVVNSAFAEEIQPLATGDYILRIKGGREYTVTRTYKKNLKLLADSWIGKEESA